MIWIACKIEAFLQFISVATLQYDTKDLIDDVTFAEKISSCVSTFSL